MILSKRKKLLEKEFKIMDKKHRDLFASNKIAIDTGNSKLSSERKSFSNRWDSIRKTER